MAPKNITLYIVSTACFITAYACQNNTKIHEHWLSIAEPFGLKKQRLFIGVKSNMVLNTVKAQVLIAGLGGIIRVPVGCSSYTRSTKFSQDQEAGNT